MDANELLASTMELAQNIDVGECSLISNILTDDPRTLRDWIILRAISGFRRGYLHDVGDGVLMPMNNNTMVPMAALAFVMGSLFKSNKLLYAGSSYITTPGNYAIVVTCTTWENLDGRNPTELATMEGPFAITLDDIYAQFGKTVEETKEKMVRCGLVFGHPALRSEDCTDEQRDEIRTASISSYYPGYTPLAEREPDSMITMLENSMAEYSILASKIKDKHINPGKNSDRAVFVSAAPDTLQ